MEITFKLFGIHKPLVYCLLTFDREVGLVANRLNTFLDPGLLCRVLNMHELHANCSTIGLTKTLDNFM